MKTFPRCAKLGVLRFDRVGRAIVSTAALESAIGSKRYQEACKEFVYYGNFPDAECVESFLCKEVKR